MLRLPTAMLRTPMRRFAAAAAVPTLAIVGAGDAIGKAALGLLAKNGFGPGKVNVNTFGIDKKIVGEVNSPSVSVTAADSAAVALTGADYAIILGGELGAIGGALKNASPGVLVACSSNSSALKVMKASGLGEKQITAIMCHKEMLGASAIAAAKNADASAVKNVIVWGNGAVDASHALVDGKWALSLGVEQLPKVGEASAEVNAAAALRHMQSWAFGTDGDWISMGVLGSTDYGIGRGKIFYSVPVVCDKGEFFRVGGVHLTAEVAKVMEADRVALLKEASA